MLHPSNLYPCLKLTIYTNVEAFRSINTNAYILIIEAETKQTLCVGRLSQSMPHLLDKRHDKKIYEIKRIVKEDDF